jgi:hypothetical protein
MKTFLEWLKEDQEITGIYPPEYGGIGTTPPAAQTGPDQVYIKASKKAAKKNEKKVSDKELKKLSL